MAFFSQMLLALLSFLEAKPLGGYELYDTELRDIDLIVQVDPRGDVCGWRCR